MKEEIWCIGVDPPCPRCDLTRQRVERIVREMGLSLNVRTFVYSDSEARAFAESIGKEAGTARTVAAKTGIGIDWNQLPKLREKPPSKPEDLDNIDGTARQWSPEYDELLKPLQEKADSVGVLMTPILLVKGEVKHHGSVPSIEKLRSWLT